MAATALAAAILIFPSAASAQTAEAPTVATPSPDEAQASAINQNQIEEIVVTAQKRSENLQDVPIAVSAVTAAALARSGTVDIVNIRAAVPSLNVTSTNGRLTMSLRGIGTTAVGAGIENPVALYVDGVYIGSAAASLLSFNQIERIEVLKGPQGTLFGRNATAGLVQVITRDPTSEFKASGDFSYANYNDITANLYVSGGIGAAVTADLAVFARHRSEGWGKNLPNNQDIYDVDHDIAVRSKWIVTPWTDGRITLIGDYFNTKDRMLPLPAIPGSISPFEPGFQPDLGYNSDLNLVPFHLVRGGGGSVRFEQGFGDVELTSVTAYRKSRTVIGGDLDGSPIDIQTYDSVQHDKQFSQELQLSSKGPSKLKWTIGAFYYYARADTPALVKLSDIGINVQLGDGALQTRSKAAYAQASYEILPDTRLTLGGRYTHETKATRDPSIRIYPIGFPAEAFPFIEFPNERLTANKFTYRASLDHRFSDELLVFVSANRGFKSGGFNIVSPGSPAFRPETLDAYEIGIKSDLFDRRVRINASGFYYDYTDIQTLKLVPGGVQTVNGGSARSYGADFDVTAILTDGLRLTAGGLWVSPRFRTFPDCPTGAPQGGVPQGVGNCADNLLPLASKFTFNVALDYDFSVAGGTLALNASAYHNSGFYTEADNVIGQDEFTQFSVFARWTAPDERLYVGAFGRNLTDERVISFGATQNTGLQQVTYADPRTYGVVAGFKF